METVIKIVVGDAAYKTEQEFNSVEDAYNDVNPITEISGVRNAFYIAISCNNPMWKQVKASEFNLKNNRNRCKQSFLSRIKKRLFA